MTTPRYIRTLTGACSVRPLTLMQHEILALCTYGVSRPFLCQQTSYPPLQVAQILDELMQHGLITVVPEPASTEEDGEVWPRA